MTKRTQSTTGRNPITATTTSSRATTADGMEERVLAFAEQLGRIAGTVQAKTAGWMDGDGLRNELARVRDGASDLLQLLTGDASGGEQKPAAATATKRQGRSGGVVDGPGKRHRRPTPADPDAKRAATQAAKLRAAKTMVKTSRLRGRG